MMRFCPKHPRSVIGDEIPVDFPCEACALESKLEKANRQMESLSDQLRRVLAQNGESIEKMSYLGDNGIQIFFTERRAGKTTELIKLSSKSGGYIVCRDPHEVFKMAESILRDTGSSILFPLRYGEFIHGSYNRGIKELYIDDVEELICNMSLVPIAAITMSYLTED